MVTLHFLVSDYITAGLSDEVYDLIKSVQWSNSRLNCPISDQFDIHGCTIPLTQIPSAVTTPGCYIRSKRNIETLKQHKETDLHCTYLK